MKNKIKNKVTISAILLMLVGLILNPAPVVEGVKNGLQICVNVLIPTLFPFFVVSKLLVTSGLIAILSRGLNKIMYPLFNLSGAAAFPIIMGFFSGFPTGAKITSELYKDHAVTQNQAMRLICFTNNPSPLFIIGSIGVGFYNSHTIGYILLFSQAFSALTTGFILRFFHKYEKVNSLNLTAKKPPKTKTSFSTNLAVAIKDSINLMLTVCGFLVFFSATKVILETFSITTFLSNILGVFMPLDKAKSLIFSGIEMVSACNFISLSALERSSKICMTSFALGFSGIAVYMQICGCLADTDIKTTYLLPCKIFQGFLGYFITKFLLTLPFATATFLPNYQEMSLNLPNPYIFGIVNVAFAIIFYFVIYCIVNLWFKNKN